MIPLEIKITSYDHIEQFNELVRDQKLLQRSHRAVQCTR